VAATLAGDVVLEEFQNLTGLPPVSRNLLRTVPSDDLGPVFYESALIAHAWLEPDSALVDGVFKDMIEGISSGRYRLNDALLEAQTAINNALIKEI